jgi:hypothetical protein
LRTNVSNFKHKAPSEDPVETANDMLRRPTNRTISPSADALEGSPGHVDAADVQGSDGQLGPDEISEPDEVVRNNEAKQHQ